MALATGRLGWFGEIGGCSNIWVRPKATVATTLWPSLGSKQAEMSWPALILSAWGDIWEEALSSGCHRTQGIYLPRAPSRPNLINPKILLSPRSMRSDLEPSIYVGAKTTLAKAWYPVKKKWFLPLLLPIQSNICPKVSNMWPFPSSFACFFCFLHVHPEKVKVWPTPFTLCHRDTSAQDSLKDGTVCIRNQNMQIFAEIKKHKSARVLHFISSGRLFWQGFPPF